jgi:diaminopimelate epimerase
MNKFFEKWHGCKNDFVIMWLPDHEGDVVLDSIKRQAASICNKDGTGIGADGILVLHHKNSSDPLPYQMSIINSDGSMASNCGNGLRVAALSIRKKHLDSGLPSPELIEIRVFERTFVCQFYKGAHPFVAVNMGQVKQDHELPWFKDGKNELEKWLSSASLGALEFHAVDIGNKHLVLKNLPSNQTNLARVGPPLQEFKSWDGINVHIDEEVPLKKEDLARAMQDIGETIDELHLVHCFERGVGETPACGSGACSVAAAAWSQGFLGESHWIAIQMPGGRLYCKKDKNSFTLAGPGTFIFEGKIQI